jgi:hypothetical protein
MSVSPALTADERAALAGVSTLTRYLSPVPDVNVATARTNMATFTYPLIQLTVDGTSGWSDIAVGDTVYIGSSAGAKDKGVYRVRAAGTGTTLNIGETSSQETGLLPVAIRTAGFADNDYITVKRRFDIWSVLPYIDAATGAIYEDRTLSVSTFNTTPPPLVDVTINNRRNHLATLIPDGTTFALEAIATPTSWTTSSGESYTYEWIVPGSGWANVTGDDTDTLTADVDPGNYVLYLNVTGDDSGLTERVCYVHVHDNDVNPPLLISEMPRSDTRDRTGRRMSFDLYSNRLASITDGACVIYFEMPTWANQWVSSGTLLNEALDTSETGVDVDDGSLFAEDDILLVDAEQMFVVSISTNTLTVTRAYNGTTAAAHADNSVVYIYSPAADVPTATRQFVGWATRHDKSAGNGLRQASLELVSPTFLLSLLNSTSTIVSVTGTVGTWQRIAAALSSASFMAWYMLRWRCANVLKLFNYTPFSVTATGQRLPSWTIDKGTVLQQIQQLATERGNFGCDSEGELYFLRHPNLMPYPRSGVVVRDTVDASLYQTASNPREKQNRVQQVRGEGFSWDGAAALPTPGYSDSPKTPGQGTSQIKLPSQVVTNQAELEQLTGDRYAQANNPYPGNSYKIQRNRDVIEPAQMQFANMTIPANLSATGSAYTSNIIPFTVTKTHNPDGTSDIEVTGEGETHNLGGDFVPVPVANDSMYSPPFMPDSIDLLPELSLGDFASVFVPASVPSPQGAPVEVGKGAIWVVADGSAIQRTFDITTEPPVIEDVTPPDAFFTAFVMVVHDKSDNFKRAAYALGNDGTNSKVAYTTDIYADTVVWEVGGQITGIGTQMESAGKPSLAGGVAVYLADSSTQHYITAPDADVDAPGNNTGIAITTGDVITITATGTWCYGSGQPYFCNDADGDPTDGAGSFPEPHTGAPLPDEFLGRLLARVGTSGTWENIGVSGGFTAADTDDLYLIMNDVTGAAYLDNSGSLLVRVAVTTGASTATVATSEDYGATWSEQTIGDAPGVDAAFCLSRYGNVSLAAVDATLEKTAAFGGAYSPVTGGGTTGTYPIAARVPWFRIGGSKTNNGTSPDFYKASAAAVSGETLWKVIAGTATAITPAVMGTDAIGVGSNCIGTYGAKRICFIGDVGGTVYVFSSRNAGSTWVNTQIDNAVSVRAQRFSPSGLIWILAAGADGIYYSDDGGVSWDARTVADGAVYGELFG